MSMLTVTCTARFSMRCGVARIASPLSAHTTAACACATVRGLSAGRRVSPSTMRGISRCERPKVACRDPPVMRLAGRIEIRGVAGRVDADQHGSDRIEGLFAGSVVFGRCVRGMSCTERNHRIELPPPPIAPVHLYVVVHRFRRERRSSPGAAPPSARSWLDHRRGRCVRHRTNAVDLGALHSSGRVARSAAPSRIAWE